MLDISGWYLELGTYAQAYLEALRLPVKSGESSARNLISDLTLSASPERTKFFQS